MHDAAGALPAGRAGTLPSSEGTTIMGQRLAALGTGAILTALAVAASAPATAAPAPATTAATRAVAHQPHGPAQAGRIVWTQVLNSQFTRARLVSARPDGSGFRVLTHPGPKRFDIDAVVSPDGRWVLFERDLPSGRSVLGVVGAGGGRVHIVPVRCTDPCAGLGNPGWAPDGRRIVFTRVMGPFDAPPGQSARSAVLYTARPDGSGLHRLSQRGIEPVYEDYHARFDASGKYLIFLRLRNRDGKTAVFRMRCDGSQIRQLTPWRLAADVPDLSLATRGPTRNLVVFETFGQGAPKGREQDIATVPATCHPLATCVRKIRYVTHNGGGPQTSFNPSWSPDGQRIAFTQALFASGKPPAGEIWTIGPDGHGRQQVSRSPRFDFRPDWGR
jgi:dipeptidyl aminopeptidase/acylaminoacyl peptidase